MHFSKYRVKLHLNEHVVMNGYTSEWIPFWHITNIKIAVTLTPSHSLSIHPCNKTTVHAAQSLQPPYLHRVPRKSHRHKKDDHMTYRHHTSTQTNQ